MNAENKVPFSLGEAKIPREFIRQDPWEIEYLFMLASYARQGIVETGRYNGGSVLVMACANSQVPIWSIDIAPRDDALLSELLASVGVGENAVLITGDSQRTRYDEIEAYDLLFVDGDHSYQGCLNDLTNWYDGLAPGGHVILHDCYFGNEVQLAVADFTRDKNVQFHTSPYKIASHRRHPEGSLCHFVKRDGIDIQ